MGAGCCRADDSFESNQITAPLLENTHNQTNEKRSKIDIINDQNQSKLIDIMCKHKKLFIDSNGQENSPNIMEFVDSFNFNTVVDFLNDFNQHLEKERADKLYLESVYNALMNNLDNNKCVISKCISIKRNSRDRRLYDRNNHNVETEKEISYHQILDNVHVHLFHTNDMGFKVFQKDIDEKNKSELKDSMQEKNQTYKNTIKANITYDKFTTILETQLFKECFIQYLSCTTSRIQHINALHKWLMIEEYDTDAIIDDVEYETNIREELKDDQEYNAACNFLNNNNPKEILYSFGKRYYYWSYFKDNENETNVIWSKDELITVNKDNEKQQIKRKWYDKGNKGYMCGQWYITPRYENFKEEVTKNEICSLPINDWNNDVQQSRLYLQTHYAKSIKANKYWQNVYGIKYDEPLSLNHMIVVCLYCNYTELQYEFTLTFRKKLKYESDELLKQRHTHFYYFGKLLREVVEVFGTEFANSPYTTFYHGLSCEMYFAKCYVRICGPMSTTLNKDIARNIFAKDDGTVVELQNQQELTFFFNCIPFSNHPNEEEILFIGGFAEIPFTSIYSMQTKTDYRIFVSILSSLNKMNNNTTNSFSFEKKKYYLKVLNELVDYKQGNRSDVSAIQSDSYILKLFKHFCYNVENVIFNMYLMKDDFLWKHNLRHTNCYGFKPLYDIFFNSELDIINLSLILNLYENVQQIVIQKWQTILYEKTYDLSIQLMEYILDALSNNRSHQLNKFIICLMISMSEENTKCPASHDLTEFNTDVNGYFCDKCEVEFPKHTKMYICQFEQTQCDYSICQDCRKVKNNSVIHLKKAIAVYQSKFNQILWNIEIGKYETHKNYISDAILFHKQLTS